MGFGKTPLCIHFSIILKQCITAMIEKTKKWGQAMVNFQSSYDRLYPLVINPHLACSHQLTLLPRLVVVNDKFQNSNDSLESGPGGQDEVSGSGANAEKCLNEGSHLKQLWSLNGSQALCRKSRVCPAS